MTKEAIKEIDYTDDIMEIQYMTGYNRGLYEGQKEILSEMEEREQILGNFIRFNYWVRINGKTIKKTFTLQKKELISHVFHHNKHAADWIQITSPEKELYNHGVTYDHFECCEDKYADSYVGGLYAITETEFIRFLKWLKQQEVNNND